MMEAYTMPRNQRSCLNCIHLDQEPGDVGGKILGGCRAKLAKSGITNDEALRKTYCGQWFLQSINNLEY